MTSQTFDPKNLWVVVAAYNEKQAARRSVEDLLQQGFEVVVVDDGSRDDTASVVEDLDIHLLRHPINLGQGAAIQTGIQYALTFNAQYIATFDSDGQHRAEDLNAMLNKLQQYGSDVCLGSRFIDKSTTMPIFRRLTLKLAIVFTYFHTGKWFTDAHNGLRVMTNRSAKILDLQENRMAHASEILSQFVRNNLAIIEHPVTIHYTEYSLAKGQTSFSGFKILFDLVISKVFR